MLKPTFNDLVSVRFAQPLPGGLDVRYVEVPELGKGEWLADFRHPFLPFSLPDQRDALYVAAMLRGKFRIVPHGVQVPTMKIFELGQQSDFAFGFDGRFQDWDKKFILRVVELTAHFEAENPRRALG